MKRNVGYKTAEQYYEGLMTNKPYQGLNPTEKQKKEIIKLLTFLLVDKDKTLKKQSVLKYLPEQIRCGVDTFLLSRWLKVRKNGKGQTLKRMILLYGKENGSKKWSNYCEQQAYTCSEEYFRETRGWTKEQFDEFNSSRAVTLSNLVERHGEEKGLEIWNSYCEQQRYTNTLEYFQEKYGDEGREKWEKYNTQKSHSMEVYIERYGREEGIEKFKEYHANKCLIGFQSDIAEDCIADILTSLKDDGIELKCYHSRHKRGEFGKLDVDRGKYYYYDLVFPDIKFCFEFNGDYFHANPDIYSADDVMRFGSSKKIAKDIWENDKNKIELIESFGFETFIMWEHEYLSERRNDIIKDIVSRIKEKANASKEESIV